jgi:hypothetical protein
MDDMCVAIPVGGVVHEEYLIENLQSLRQSPCKVYVGIDATQSLFSLGNHSKVREICKEYAHQVIEFPSESYYRPGSFWKKIYLCWKASGAKYVRALGYDDLLPPNLIKNQYLFMKERPDLECSYANCVIKDENEKKEIFQNTELNGYRKVWNIGRNPFSFISWIIRFDSICNADFESKLERSSMGFEYLLHKELFNRNYAHFPSSPNESPIRREHPYTVSEYAKKGIIHNKVDTVLRIRELTGYSENQTLEDWRSLKMESSVHEVRRKHSLILSWLAYCHDKLRGVPYPL